MAKLQKIYTVDLAVNKKKQNDDMEKDKPLISGLLKEWSKMENLMENIFSIMESHYPEPKLPIRP